MPDDERTVAPPEEPQREGEEPALPTLAKGKTEPAIKGKKIKVKQQSGPKRGGPEQAVLPFVEKTGADAKRSQKIGKKHGAKKGKK